MRTVPQPTSSSKVYYANLFDESGVVGKLDGRIVFLADESLALIEVEPDMVNFLVVLGQVDLCDSQAAMDKLRGGYAKVCCSRTQEVA